MLPPALYCAAFEFPAAAGTFINRRADLEGKDKYSKFKAVDNHSNWVIPIFSPPSSLALSGSSPAGLVPKIDRAKYSRATFKSLVCGTGGKGRGEEWGHPFAVSTSAWPIGPALQFS